MIDMRKMRKVTVDPKSKTITAEGGCNWQDVDEAGQKHGLATVGGTVNHTGIGGLTLGGGYGWLSGKYGLTVDVLLSAKVVLADGRLVTASETENEDLFWAIRGKHTVTAKDICLLIKRFQQDAGQPSALPSSSPTKALIKDQCGQAFSFSHRTS